jgi:pimeloyl-ACP methyl ester carboxylesterase
MASDYTYWRAPELGEAREVEVPGGRIRAFEAGEGAPVVFIHGFGVNANLWRKVVPRLSGEFRCVTLELPIGGHEFSMPGADLSAPGVADLAAAAIEALGLEDVTLVGNDTGGAICQLIVDRHPELVGRLLLTSSDAYEEAPPKLFRYALAPLRFPALAGLVFMPLRVRALRQLPFAFGWTTHSKLDPAVSDSWVLPALTSKAVRNDVSRFFAAFGPGPLLDAASRFPRFTKPVTIAWSADERIFSKRNAERLASAFPNARLEWIENSRTFSPEDRPDRVAELVAELARRKTPEPAAPVP